MTEASAISSRCADSFICGEYIKKSIIEPQYHAQSSQVSSSAIESRICTRMSTDRPTLEAILEMGRRSSPDTASSPFSLVMFHDFLKKSHCEENLQFILITDSFLDSNESFPVKLWNNSVYLQFIRLDSPQECNLPQEIREKFDECYVSQTRPSRADIEAARKHILLLLQDAFNKFINKQRRCSVNTCPSCKSAGASAGASMPGTSNIASTCTGANTGNSSPVSLLSPDTPIRLEGYPFPSEYAIEDDDDAAATPINCLSPSGVPLERNVPSTPSSSFSSSSAGFNSLKLKHTGKKLVHKFKFRRSSSGSSGGSSTLP